MSDKHIVNKSRTCRRVQTEENENYASEEKPQRESERYRKDAPRVAERLMLNIDFHRVPSSSSDEHSSSESLIIRTVSSRFVSGHANVNRISFSIRCKAASDSAFSASKTLFNRNGNCAHQLQYLRNTVISAPIIFADGLHDLLPFNFCCRFGVIRHESLRICNMSF